MCHPKSSYVTTKLNGISTCGCNNNAIFSDSNFHVSYHRCMPATLNWPRQSIGSSVIAALLNSLSFAFTNSFLPKYRVKYYDYVIKWYSGI